MAKLKTQIAELLKEIDAHRNGNSRRIHLPDEVKRRIVDIYNRKGTMTLKELGDQLNIAPYAIRRWLIDFKPEGVPRHQKSLIPVKVVGSTPLPGAFSSQDTITVSYREVKISVPLSADPGLLTGVVNALVRGFTC